MTRLPLGHEEGRMTRSDFQKQISPALWRVDLSYLVGSRGSELNLNSGQIRFRSPKTVVFLLCNLSSIFLCAGKQGAPPSTFRVRSSLRCDNSLKFPSKACLPQRQGDPQLVRGWGAPGTLHLIIWVSSSASKNSSSSSLSLPNVFSLSADWNGKGDRDSQVMPHF